MRAGKLVSDYYHRLLYLLLTRIVILLKSRKYAKLDYKSLDNMQKNCIFAISCRLIAPVIVERLWADI